MNRLDDDDDEIREWMLNQQFSNQSPGGLTQPYTGWNSPGGAPPPSWGWNAPGGIPQQNAWQANPWNNPWAYPYAAPYPASPYPAAPYPAAPGDSWTGPSYPRADTSPSRPRQERTLPRLTPREYALMPKDVQREYRRAVERERLLRARPESFTQGSSPGLPNLTPEEYARMPRDLQRQYKRDFDREYARYRALEARKRSLRRGALPPRDTLR